MTYSYNNSILGDYLTPSGNNLIVENPIIISSGSINNTVIGNNIATSGYFTNLFSNGVNVSVSGHVHTSNDISNFDSSVSGLIPVKNLTSGSGIGIVSSSGNFTISVTGTFGLTSEEVDDRVSNLLVPGTGVSLTYNDPSGILTIDNLHSEINVLSQEPQGFVNRTDSLISFNDATRTFTIQPAISGGSYLIYAEGVKVVKSNIETVVIGSGTALNYIHFDTTPPYALHTKTTGFNFDTDIPIAFIHWNSDINQSTFFGEERHGIRMDSITHKWIHNTFGVQYISGLSIGGYTLLGDGSLNSHAQIDISDGILYQEDIIINITDDNGANSSNEFVQPLSPIAYIPTYYHSGSTGQWVRDVATSFPLKYNATRAQYNLYSGGTWTTPNVTNNRYFAMWIVATNDMNDPILAILGQREDSSLTAAESNNNWGDINLTNIPTQELRPLYRLIFVTNDTFTNTPKSSLQSILDIKKSIQSVSAGVTQNDHGSLFGLGDDDHSQYVHIDNNRTISAVHNFSNGLTAGGLINAASGSFNSLNVNGTGVSLVGHTHTASDITNFNTSVSGLLTPYQLLLTNPVTGTGIVNHIPYWGSASGLLSDSDQLVWDSTNNRLGIGTASPSGQLHVVGTGIFNSGIFIPNNVSIRTSTASGSQFNILRLDPADNVRLERPSASSDMYIAAATAFILKGNDRVGMGHVSPLNRLAVNGATTIGSSNNVTAPANGLLVEGSVGIGTATPSSQLHVIGTGIFSENLLVNGTGVSLQGHTHTSSQITDFNSSVSGLLPTISNSGDNRLLTSTGSSVGINAESNLTFDGSTFNIDGNLTFDTFTESLISIGNSSSGVVLSIGSGTVQTCTLTNSCTFTMPTATAGKSFTMFLNTGSGNFTASFSGVLWSDSAPPTITATSNKVDILSFISDGNYWYGSYSQNYG